MGDVFREFVNLFRGDEPLFLKLVKLISILSSVMVMVFLLESAMGLVTIGRLERKVNLLKELNALTESGLGNREQLETVFDETVYDLEQYNPDLIEMVVGMQPGDFQSSFIEVLAGASIWILIGLISLRTTKGGLATKLLGCGLFVTIGLFMGILSSSIIESNDFNLTIILNAFCGTAPLILLVVALVRRSQAQNQSGISATRITDHRDYSGVRSFVKKPL